MRRLFGLLATSALGALAVPAPARLVRIQVDSITPAPVGTAPASTLPIPYEILRGRFFGALDPADAHNNVITDIDGAPRDAKGRVQYSATFAIARPVDRSQATGIIVLRRA